MKKKDLIKISDIKAIKSRWDTGHECMCCDNSFCGTGAALVMLKDGGDAIICQNCLNAFRTQKPKRVALVYEKSDRRMATKMARELREMGAKVTLLPIPS